MMFKPLLIKIFLKLRYIYKYSFNIENRYKHKINHSNLLDSYQKNDVISVLDIIFKYWQKPQNISALDLGCTTHEVNIIAKYVKDIIGININFHDQDVENHPKNVKYLKMDGSKLDFPDNSFDFIYTLNTYEHILDIDSCIKEQYRVLKPGGYSYSAWSPIWSGPKGHHVHDDMVKYWEKDHNIEHQGYKNNGEFIPDWSHLLLSKNDMIKLLAPKIKNHYIIELIINVIYKTDEINRLFFDDFIKIIEQNKLKIIKLEKKEYSIPSEILEKLNIKYNKSDFSTQDCKILLQKTWSENL